MAAVELNIPRVTPADLLSTPPQQDQKLIAYYCAEFGVNENLPIYSGGLGVLSGDQLKAASDLGMNIIGIGLGYNYGYFKQQLDESGWQREVYRRVNFDAAQAYPLKSKTGKQIYVTFPIEDRKVVARVDKVQVGHIPLYLLNTDTPLNKEEGDRWITGHLYGGDDHTRIRQEIALGIGGANLVRTLHRMGEIAKEPDYHHMNEGHAAFLTFALARQERFKDPASDWRVAIERVSEKLRFTSHTPVPAGIDMFDSSLVESQLGTYLDEMDRRDKAQRAAYHLFLEKANHLVSHMAGEKWCQLHLGLSTAGLTNGVSEENAKVVNNNWGKILKDANRPPAIGITNGVHIPSWMYPGLRELIDDNMDRFRTQHHEELYITPRVMGIPDKDLLRARRLAKLSLVDAVNLRRLERGEKLFDPDLFTLGYARRSTSYKRNTIPFADPGKLIELLIDPDKPMQMVISGKAHPKDETGKLMLQIINKTIHDYPEITNRVEFIEGYNIAIARILVRAVDYWANFPRVPYEASGTSGEKVAANGGRNGSTPTGWEKEYPPALWDEFQEHYIMDGIGCDDILCKEVAGSFSYFVGKAKNEFYGNGFEPSLYWKNSIRQNIIGACKLCSASTMMIGYRERVYSPAS